MSRRLADRSRSVGQQPGKHGWLVTVVNLTGASRTERSAARQVSDVVEWIINSRLLVTTSTAMT